LLKIEWRAGIGCSKSGFYDSQTNGGMYGNVNNLSAEKKVRRLLCLAKKR
jgi:hypothetical protein